MQIQLTKADLQFLSRLSVSPDYEIFRSIIERELLSLDGKCRTLDGPMLFRAQGAATWLVDLVDEISKAKQELVERQKTQVGDRVRHALRQVPYSA